MANDEVSCKRCRFWEFPLPQFAERTGMCRRYPPNIFFDGPYTSYHWPNTRFNDWCGEFETSKTNYDDKTLEGKNR